MRRPVESCAVFCLVLLIPPVWSAAARADNLVPDWIERWASPEGKQDEAADVVADAAGNLYVTGSSHFTPINTWDLVTVSYAPDGTERWVDIYDGGGTDLGVAAVLEASGSLLVLGRSNADYLLIRYDRTTGQRLSVMVHEGGGIENSTALTTDAAGHIYVTGSSWPPGTDNQNDYYTVKLDSQGTELWSVRYNGPGAFLFAHDVAYDIALDVAGDVFVTGYSNAPGTATGDYYTVKYRGSDGLELWADRYSGGSNETAWDLVLDEAGDLYVTGGSYQTGFKFVTLKYANLDGSRQWVAIDAPAACSVATEIALDSFGDVYISGWADPDCDESNFNEDIATIKHRASDGAVEWSALYGNPAVGFFDLPHDLVIDSHDNVYVTGENTGLLVVLQYDPESGNQLGLSTIDSGPDEIASARAAALDSAQSLLVTGIARNFNTEDRDFFTLKFPGDLFSDGFESGDTSAWSSSTP